MTKWLNQLTFRQIILLAPVIAFMLVVISYGVFGYFGVGILNEYERLQNKEISRSQSFIRMGNELARNHVLIYEHMNIAQGDVDEGDFYDNGKPLLLKIHELETRVQNYLESNHVDKDMSVRLNSLLKKLVSYRNNTTNAMLMATVNLKLAQNLLQGSTKYYIDLNNQFLNISQIIQSKLKSLTNQSHSDAKKQLSYISLISILVIASLILFSFYFSRSLSRHFYERVFTLKSLLASDTTDIELAQVTSEMNILSLVIEKVKNNFKNLELANQEIVEQEQKVSTILDNLLDGVITIDSSGNVLTYNRSAETIFGYTAEEVIGQNVSRLMPEMYANKHNAFIHSYLETGVKHIIGLRRNVYGQRKNKKQFPMYLSVVELPVSADGKRTFIGSCQDISKIKQQEEQLRLSQKMDALGKLTGGIAHDYNNMLGVILGYAELLEIELNGQDKLLEYIKEINHAGHRGSLLTKKLLSFSKQKGHDSVALNINNILLDSKDMLQKTLTARIQITLDLADDLWSAALDVNDLEDAVLNLSINAMHAMEGGGQLTFSTRNNTLNLEDANALNLDAGDYVLLRVGDTGCGIDKDVQDKIFEPFYTSKGEHGTGLGLSQVYGFVERSKGAIHVYSEPGRGTLMTLYFHRLEGDKANSSIKNIDSDVLPQGGGETILVVDDEVALLNLTGQILSKHGYHVITANSAKRALELLGKESVEVLLSDIIMPDMDGYELAAIVQEKYPDIKIQLASGFSDERHIDMVERSLHESILHKPYHSQTLLQKLRELLDAD